VDSGKGKKDHAPGQNKHDDQPIDLVTVDSGKGKK